jgi:ParB family chromosome partitioning protein
VSTGDKRRGLGRGLDDLIGDLADSGAPVPPEGEVELDRIEPNPFQPRRLFPAETLEGLAASIRSRGLPTRSPSR